MTDDTVSDARPARTLVRQGGRDKAYRPLATDARRAALRRGLAAYGRGDFFEAHELLEPAWMGTADPVERDLYQGLIKLAAGFVHEVRGNPAGIVKNLRGARERLARAAEGGPVDRSIPEAAAIDAGALVVAIDARLATLAAEPSTPVTPPTVPFLEVTSR
jgi:hypothetical protein